VGRRNEEQVLSIKQLIFIAVGLGLLYLLFTVGAPFLLALVIAIFMEPVTLFLMRRLHANRIIAATISSTLFTLGLIAAMVGMGFKVIAELIAFWGKVPGLVNEASAFTETFIDNLRITYADNFSEGAATQLEALLTGIMDGLFSVLTSLSKMVISFASGVPGMFVFFMVFIVAVYLFNYSLNTLKHSFLQIFDIRSRDQVSEMLSNLKQSIFGFIKSQFILSLMTFLLTLTGLLILQLRYPLAISLLVVVVDIMPILGTGSVLVPWGLFLIIFTGNTFAGMGLIILFLVITIVRRVIEPKVLGDSIGIGALPALISLYVGLQLVGLIGVFLGPLVVIIYMAARKAGLFQIRIHL
jgi:sporulation integral membrane protein YtvI